MAKSSMYEERALYGFFKGELLDNLLAFWLPRCEDRINGAYFNCFSNDGSRLVSTDKYTWSMGRFVWIFSKLAMTNADLFTEAQRKEFLRLAKSGRDFLMKHSLIAPDDWRCVFLMTEDGTPKKINGYDELDMSISADCFVVCGLARYSVVAGDRESWIFARKLYDSVWDRYMSGSYRSLPYPLSPKYRSHSRPMILTNVGCELYHAAKIYDSAFCAVLEQRLQWSADQVFNVFCDGNNLLHEYKYADDDFPDNAFGHTVNPGHTVEDMWFQQEAQDILGTHQYEAKIAEVVKQTFKTGWDEDYGGIFHFATVSGGSFNEEPGEAADEPQMKLVLDDWGSKLWWVHSEMLYTTLLMYRKTGDAAFMDMFRKTFAYVYSTFPNTNPEIGEWIQIRARNGAPLDKVVALPVKDPYHIIRNVILIIELLDAAIKENKQ